MSTRTKSAYDREQELKQKVRDAENALRDAVAYAEKHGLTFSFQPSNDRYGPNADFYPITKVGREKLRDRENENENWFHKIPETNEEGWRNSSMMCY